MSDAPAAPRSERVLRAAGDWTRVQRRRLVYGGLALVVILWIASGVFVVESGSNGIVVRGGSIVRHDLGPGLHMRLPGFEREVVFPTSEVHRLEVAGDEGRRLTVLTGDENIVLTSLVAQYRVGAVDRFLYRAESSEELIAQCVRAAFLEVTGQETLDELLTTGKARVQQDVRTRAQQLLQRFEIGATLLSVNLQTLDPPAEAASMFRSVQDARSESQQTVTDGRIRADRTVSMARAEANKLVEDARAAADTEIAQARGAVERFNSLREQHRRFPEVTRDELWRSQMAKSLPLTETIVLGPGEKPRLDIHLQGEQRAGAR